MWAILCCFSPVLSRELDGRGPPIRGACMASGGFTLYITTLTPKWLIIVAACTGVNSGNKTHHGILSTFSTFDFCSLFIHDSRTQTFGKGMILCHAVLQWNPLTNASCPNLDGCNYEKNNGAKSKLAAVRKLEFWSWLCLHVILRHTA